MLIFFFSLNLGKVFYLFIFSRYLSDLNLYIFYTSVKKKTADFSFSTALKNLFKQRSANNLFLFYENIYHL